MDTISERVTRAVEPVNLQLPEFKERVPWLGGDLQSIRNFLRRPSVRLGPFTSERLVLSLDGPTGDRVTAVLHLPRAGTEGGRPVVVLIHGLTGCEDSFYIRASAAHLLRTGFPVLRLNLRGAGPARPLCKLQYHAGRSEDVRAILSALPPRVTAAGVVAVGFSLGGNLLLKYLGETGSRAPILAAATVSAPLDLTATAHRIAAPRSALYHWYFLRECQREALAPAAEVTPEERREVLRAQNLWEFDERFTAPRNGFEGAAEYYKQNSSRLFIDEIAVPTLLIHALDDPIVPDEPYRQYDWRRNRHLLPMLQPKGGHVGFHDRRGGTWHDRAIQTFFEQQLGLA